MHMQLLTSAFPTVSLPSADAITHPAIREAVQIHVGAMERVIASHTIAGKLRAGHQLDDLSPEQVAEAIALSREGDTFQAVARERLLEALAKHRGEWVQDTDKRVTKARNDVVKALTAAKAALDEYELRSGVQAMLNSGSPELKWRAATEFEVGAATAPIQAALDRLTAGEQV